MDSVDLLVAGSGAGGLSAAVMAAHLGLKTLVIEKEPFHGGATAWSGGWMWVPRNSLQSGSSLSVDALVKLMRAEPGGDMNDARLRAFLEAGSHMVDFFRANTAVQFSDSHAAPEFHQGPLAATLSGGMVCAAPYNAHDLGPQLGQLRRPLDLISPWGMGISAGTDLRHLLDFGRSLPSFRYALRRIAAHFRDLGLHGRGMTLTGGNALVARLLRSALVRGVELRASTPLLRLRLEEGRVVGAVAGRADGGEAHINVRHGVVLACGGVGHDVRRWQSLQTIGSGSSSARRPMPEPVAVAPAGNTGDGLRAAEAAGARVQAMAGSAAALVAVSFPVRPDGTTRRYPHLYERLQPGLLAVCPSGQRVADGSVGYHQFAQRLLVTAGDAAPQAWLVCDHAFIRRHGLGAVRPRPFGLAHHLRSGYLRRASSVQALASDCGMDAAGLLDSVAAHNDAVHADRASTQALIARAPFYAVQVSVGTLAGLAGLDVDADSRVLDGNGLPIAGLHACGDDAASVGSGRYPSGGMPLGAAMTFGFIAAHTAAGANWRETGAHRVVQALSGRKA